VHVRYVCIALFILSYRTHALHSVWRTVYFIPIFSLFVLRNIYRYFLLGMTVEARRAAAFLSWYFLNLSPWGQVWFTLHAGIRCHFLFHKHVFVVFLFIVFQQKKKYWGEDAELYFFLLIAFHILHVFLPDISVHCALIKYAYIWLRVYAWYLLSFPVAS
jgi:hypothetical protein